MNSSKSPAPQPPFLSKYGWVLAIAVAYVALCSFHIGDPLTNDEVWEFYASKKMLEEGRAGTVTGGIHNHHPYGYYFFLSRAQQLFGSDEFGSRVLGILATLLCFAVILRIYRVLKGSLSPTAATLLAVFYLLAPTVVQGSLIVTADTAIHHLFTSLFLLAVIERYPYRKIDSLLLPALCALMLWIKIVTPTLIVGSVVLFFLLRREWSQAARAAFVTGLGGLALFLGTWSVYCWANDLAPFTIFTYLMQVGESRTATNPKAKALLTGRHTLTLAIWLGFPYVVLMVRSLVEYLRTRKSDGSLVGLLILTGGILCVAHTLISGITIGFPRYHFTMMPLWAVVLAYFTADAVRIADVARRRILILAVGCCAYLTFVVGDPLDVINFDLKLRFLAAPGVETPTLLAMALTLILFGLPTAIALAYSMRDRNPARSALLFTSLTAASFLSLNALQASADYNTGYAYGERGTSDVVAYCSERVREGSEIVSCKDIVYHTVERGYMQDWRWSERDYLLERLRDAKTQFVVMGTQQNTIPQLDRMWSDEEIDRLLSDQYDHRQIGSYFVWERSDSTSSSLRKSSFGSDSYGPQPLPR